MNDLLKLHKTVGGNGLNKLTYREYLDEHFKLGELKDVLVENNKLNFYHIPTFLELNGEDFEDKSLNNHSITKTGNVSIVDTDIGKSYYFNATLGGIDLPQNTITINKTYSIETLVRFKGNPTDYHVIFHQGSSSYDIRLSIPTARTTIDFHYWNGSTTNQGCGSITLPKALDLNVWYKLTFIFVAETLMFKVYLDDVFIGDKKCTSLPTLKSGVQRIGANASTGGYANLEMKYINFYNYDLIAYEPPTEGYRISPPIELPKNIVSSKIDWEGEGKISILPLQVNNTSHLMDSKYCTLHLDGETIKNNMNLNTTVTEIGKVATTEGVFGKNAYVIDGSTNYIQIPKESNDVGLFNSSDFTIDFWLRDKYTDYATSTIYLGIWAGDDVQSQWAITRGTTKGGIRFICRNSASSSTLIWNSSGNLIPDDEWCHIAVMRKGSTLIVTINGKVALKETNFIGNFSSTSTSPLLVGRTSHATNLYPTKCSIQEIRIHKKAIWDDLNVIPPILPSKILEYIKVSKGEALTLDKPYLYLKQEVKGEETISNVKLELKHKTKKEYIRPKDLLNNEEDVSKTFLYKSGEEYTSLTGGWVSTSENTASIGKSFTKGSSEMIIWSHNNNALGAGYWVHTNNTIDLTPYSKVKALLVKNGTGYRNRMFVGEDTNANYFDYVNAPNGEFIVEIDISSINSSNRIRFTHFTANGQNSEIKIKQVWLEK